MSPWVPAVITGGLAFIAAVLVAVLNRSAQKELADRAANAEEALATLRADLDRRSTDYTAKTSYEYEALKRLYGQVNPLLFQLREFCEPGLTRIRRLVSREIVITRTEHVLSSTQRLFAPLVVAQEIQRHLTAVDLSLDKTVWAQYVVARELLITFHEGPALAAIPPVIEYRREPDRGRRQHMTYAQLQRLVEFLTIQDSDGTRRPLRQSELDDRHDAGDPRLDKVLEPVHSMCVGADPTSTPVLWRLLLTQACLMSILVDLVDRNAHRPDVLLPANIESFNWAEPKGGEDFLIHRDAAKTYVERRLHELHVL